MKNSFSTPLLLLIILVTNYSCISYRAVEITNVENIKFHLNDPSPSVSFDLLIRNPNSKGVRLTHAEANLFTNEKLIGIVELQKSLKIPSNSEIAVPLYLKSNPLNLSELLPVGLGMLFGDSSFLVRVNGNIRVRKFLWRRKYNFALSQNISIDFLKSLNIK